MANAIVEQASVEADNTSPVGEKALMIRERARAMIANASLQQVRERLPEYVPVVEQLISSIDVNNPLTLAQVGSWALAEQADTGLELLGAVQKGPSQQALLEIDQFEAKLRERVKPLEERLQARGRKSVAQNSIFGRFVGLAKSVAMSAAKRRSSQTRDFKLEMHELEQDNNLLVTIVAQTVTDTTKMKSILAQNKEVPKIIEDQVEKALDTHAEAAEKLYLSLVAVNEFQRDLTTTVIPQLEAKAAAPNAIDSDIDAVQRAKEALGLLETRRTDLMAAFLNTCLQRGMVTEMGKINASSAIEMERLENIALPQMLSMLGTLALQQRTGELVAGSKAANRILGDTTRSTAKGFGRVLQLSKEADEARLETAQAVVRATGDTLTAVRRFRQHEAGHIERQKAVQVELAEAVGNLRAAAARIGFTPQDGRLLPDQRATDSLVLQATGVSLPQQRIDTQSGGAAVPETEQAIREPARPATTPATDPASDLFKAARQRRNDRA